MPVFEGLVWFVLMLLPLVILQRLLHREIQAVLLILTRNPAMTVGVFSLIFLPGVFLHESSHFLMAKILGVPTGNFSLVPRPLSDGRLQLGYVETARMDPLRDSLIGLAPLISGVLVVAYISLTHLNLLPLWDSFRGGQVLVFWQKVLGLPQVNDFPLWFYITFTVSSTMLPSASDRHAFLPLALFAGLITGLVVLAGVGPLFLDHVVEIFNIVLRSVATVFGLSLIVHLLLLVPVMVIHILLAGLTGVDVK